MRRNVLRFYAVLFFFVLALAAIQFVLLQSTSIFPVSGFAVSENRSVAVVLTTLPLLALFLLGVLIILLVMQPYAPVPRQRHFELENISHARPHRF